MSAGGGVGAFDAATSVSHDLALAIRDFKDRERRIRAVLGDSHLLNHHEVGPTREAILAILNGE